MGQKSTRGALGLVEERRQSFRWWMMLACSGSGSRTLAKRCSRDDESANGGKDGMIFAGYLLLNM